MTRFCVRGCLKICGQGRGRVAVQVLQSVFGSKIAVSLLLFLLHICVCWCSSLVSFKTLFLVFSLVLFRFNHFGCIQCLIRYLMYLDDVFFCCVKHDNENE